VSVALSAVALLAAWLGAASLVAAVVAPAAFAVLPSRTLAGALVGRVLPVLFWSGMALGVVLAMLGSRMGVGLLGSGAATVLAGACVAAQLVVAPRIEAVRRAIGGPMDALDPSDPRRMAFGRLHGLSVLLMGVGALGALVTLILVARQITARSTA
jgi:hypothetical protein